jgi:hypothetical protein
MGGSRQWLTIAARAERLPPFGCTIRLIVPFVVGLQPAGRMNRKLLEFAFWAPACTERCAGEKFVAFFVSRQHRLLGELEVSRGSANAVFVDPRRTFKQALLLEARGVILLKAARVYVQCPLEAFAPALRCVDYGHKRTR